MDLLEKIAQEMDNCEKILIGIGEEWDVEKVPEIGEVYEKMSGLMGGRDFFVITTVMDGEIWESSIEEGRVVAPCGNRKWQQCSKACRKDIWEKGEVADEKCPHCGAALTGNTIEAANYIEEGYLPQWNAYTQWLAGTLNKKLMILELGVGFWTPTVIRWPFEKMAIVNKKAHLYRVHGRLAQMSEEVREKGEPIAENSVEFFRNLGVVDSVYL